MTVIFHVPRTVRRKGTAHAEEGHFQIKEAFPSTWLFHSSNAFKNYVGERAALDTSQYDSEGWPGFLTYTGLCYGGDGQPWYLDSERLPGPIYGLLYHAPSLAEQLPQTKAAHLLIPGKQTQYRLPNWLFLWGVHKCIWGEPSRTSWGAAVLLWDRRDSTKECGGHEGGNGSGWGRGCWDY